MSPQMEKVLEEIRQERYRQAEQFSTEHDSRHHPEIWIAIAARHLGLAMMDGGLINRTIWRRQMVRLGAVAAAAVEAFDRLMEQVADDPIPRLTHITVADRPDGTIEKLKVVAQDLANKHGEPALVIPVGSESPINKTVFHYPFAVLLSQCEKGDVSRAIFRAEPEVRK